MIRFRSLLLALMLTVCHGAFAQDGVKTADAVNDSVSGAFATVWADYLRQDMPMDTAAASKFLEGLNEAFRIKPPMEQYYRGVLVGLSVAERIESMKSMGMPVDGERTIEVLCALLSGREKPSMTSEQANEYLNNYVAGRMRQEPDTVATAAEQAFVDAVAQTAGAVTLPSGVVMVTLIEGVGECPAAGEDVMVSYEGRLSDGTVFDTTEAPIAMTVGKLVPGFNQGLMKMRPGGTYRLVIPAEMGYGREGIPGVIPGNAALDFTVTLQ